jgi:hypothetical protein
VHIRFRFDKSKHNFTIRKYKRIPTAAFDPVLAVINIFRRAHMNPWANTVLSPALTAAFGTPMFAMACGQHA